MLKIVNIVKSNRNSRKINLNYIKRTEKKKIVKKNLKKNRVIVLYLLYL